MNRKTLKLLLCATLLALLASCSTQPAFEGKIGAFHSYAVEKVKHPERAGTPPIDGLDATLGYLDNGSRMPGFEESSILVSDPSQPESPVVQVIVSPRVSGSMLDPVEPSDEFIRELKQSTIKSLRTSYYTDVTIGHKK